MGALITIVMEVVVYGILLARGQSMDVQYRVLEEATQITMGLVPVSHMDVHLKNAQII